MLELYGYWRSSASYRVRIGLALKGIEYTYIPVNLKTGEQYQQPYISLNPQGLVPMLVLPDGQSLTQSPAILDFIDRQFDGPELLPRNPVQRAHVIAAANIVACDTAPIQNLRVLRYIRNEYDQDDTGVKAWATHWIAEGLSKVEAMMKMPEWHFILQSEPGYFECMLIPQIYNAVRWGGDLERFPAINGINQRCLKFEAFQKAHPDNQPDAEPKT